MSLWFNRPNTTEQCRQSGFHIHSKLRQRYSLDVRRVCRHQLTGTGPVSRMIDLSTLVERCMYDRPCSSNDPSFYDNAPTQ